MPNESVSWIQNWSEDTSAAYGACNFGFDALPTTDAEMYTFTVEAFVLNKDDHEMPLLSSPFSIYNYKVVIDQGHSIPTDSALF